MRDGARSNLSTRLERVRSRWEDFAVAVSAQTTFPPTRLPTWILLIGLALVITLGVGTRVNQAQRMSAAPERYVIEGEWATTTADAGYFMQVARQFAQTGRFIRPAEQYFPNEYDPLDPPTAHTEREAGRFQPGLALPYLLVRWHQANGVSLERAAYHLLLLGVVLSGLAAFSFFATLGQPGVGVLAAASATLAWPVAFRMTVGMVDTDILNPAFFFVVLALLAKALRSDPAGTARLWVGLAGLANLAFYLWYGKAAFVLLFATGFVLAAWTHRWSGRDIAIAAGLFLLASDPRQLISAFSAALGFERAYLGALQDFDHPAFRVIWSSIGEASKPPLPLLEIFFGSLVVYAMCVLGMVLWLLQDLRRAAAAFPLVVFWLLFHISGVRFALYATPLLWIGFGVSITALAVQAERMVTRRRHVAMPARLRGLTQSAAVLVTVAGLLPAALPSSYLSPPDLTPADVTLLRQVPRSAPRPILVAPWSQGYAIGYRTELPTIHDGGGGQISVKTALFARAMVQTDPEQAAVWLRRATYFSERALRAAYPAMPPETNAIGTDRDLYLFLPGGFAGEIALMARVAAASPLSLDASGANYPGSPRPAAVMLGEDGPERWGDFERIAEATNGARLYRLPASTRVIRRQPSP